MEPKTNDTATLMAELEARKAQLRQSTAEFKNSIESQINELTDTAIKYTLRGLVFIGVAAISYFIFKYLAPKSSAPRAQASDSHALPKTKQSSIWNHPIAQMIFSNIAAFLLSIAREELIALLEKQLAKNRDESDKHKASHTAAQYSA